MRSKTEKRSVLVGKHKTSLSLEDEFWTSLKEIAASRPITCSDLLREINERRQSPNLSSAIRLFVLQHYQERAQEAVVTPLAPYELVNLHQPALHVRWATYAPSVHREVAWWTTGERRRALDACLTAVVQHGAVEVVPVDGLDQNRHKLRVRQTKQCGPLPETDTDLTRQAQHEVC